MCIVLLGLNKKPWNWHSTNLRAEEDFVQQTHAWKWCKADGLSWKWSKAGSSRKQITHSREILQSLGDNYAKLVCNENSFSRTKAMDLKLDILLITLAVCSLALGRWNSPYVWEVENIKFNLFLILLPFWMAGSMNGPGVVIMRNILIRKISWSIKYGKRLVGYMLSVGERSAHKKIDLLTTTFLFSLGDAVMCGEWCQTYWLDSDSENSSNFLTNYSIRRSRSADHASQFFGTLLRHAAVAPMPSSAVGKNGNIQRRVQWMRNYCESLKVISRRVSRLTIHLAASQMYH